MWTHLAPCIQMAPYPLALPLLACREKKALQAQLDKLTSALEGIDEQHAAERAALETRCTMQVQRLEADVADLRAQHVRSHPLATAYAATSPARMAAYRARHIGTSRTLAAWLLTEHTYRLSCTGFATHVHCLRSTRHACNDTQGAPVVRRRDRRRAHRPSTHTPQPSTGCACRRRSCRSSSKVSGRRCRRWTSGAGER